MDQCPVCLTGLTGFYDSQRRYDCPRCGTFQLDPVASAMLPELVTRELQGRALMSHALRRAGPRKIIQHHELESYWKNKRLPSAASQANDLLLWVGQKQLAPEAWTRCASYYMGAWLGTSLTNPRDRHEGLVWVIEFLQKEGLLEADEDETSENKTNPPWLYRLTMRGWARFTELQTQRSDSRTAFMAMQFNNSVLSTIVEDYFKPAVLRTGFELRKLTDKQPAGLIDNQIRSAILSGRFVISDLSDRNPGAYWEAGYAEGLGQAVIYTCDVKVWTEAKTHFDTNHHVTIPWDRDNPQEAADQLVATIRATFRDDARQID